MGECNSYIFNCEYSLHTPTKQYFHHICKHADTALPSSKNPFLRYEMNSLIIPKPTLSL